MKDDGVQVQVQGGGLHRAGERGRGRKKRSKVEGDIFSGRSVGPWQFCHACFSQDLCPTVLPFKRRLLPSTVIIAPTPGAVLRRSTNYRPITVWPFWQRDAAHEIPKASPTKAATTTTTLACRFSTSRHVTMRYSGTSDIMLQRINPLSRDF